MVLRLQCIVISAAGIRGLFFWQNFLPANFAQLWFILCGFNSCDNKARGNKQPDKVHDVQ